MIIEGLSHRFVAAVVLLGIVVLIVIIKGLAHIMGKGARALRDRDRSDPTSFVADSAPADGSADSVTGFGRRRRALAASDATAGAPDFVHPVLGAMTSAQLLRAVAEAGAPAPPPEGPLPAAIEAARWRPIVFRQFLPEGPGKDGLSFCGGQPIAPADFRWPRRHGSEGQPLTFIMQWDCEKLAALDATGLLPTDGVLYCFIDLEWGNGDPQARHEAFLHHPGPTEGWAEIPVPADAPPIFGDRGPRSAAGCTDKIDNPADFVPRVMPRFPFVPAAFDYPRSALDPEHGDRLFWGEASTGEALVAIAKADRADAPLGELPGYGGPFARPFPAYPHDFAAVRHIAARMIRELDWIDSYLVKSTFPDMSDDERRAAVAVWVGEARELYRLGCQRPMGTQLDQPIADDIWHWLETRQAVFGLGFDRFVVEAVDLSLGVGSHALGRVPREWIDRAMRNHDIASEYLTHEYFDAAKHGDRTEYERLKDAGEIPRVRKVHAPTPAHMFGPPSYVQGDVEEMIDDHLLLLELPSHGTPGLAIGEGVLQYLIKPEDLAARRFDRVQSVISGY